MGQGASSAGAQPALARVAHVAASDVSLRYLLLNQMRSVAEAGYSVAAIAARGVDADAVASAGIRYIEVPVTRRYAPLADLRSLWRMYRLFRRERFDIVHTHTPKGGLIGQYAALLAGVPVRVHTIHGLYFPGDVSPRLRWLFVLLERVTMAFSHLNLSQNAEDIPVAIRERICAAERIVLLGNGIDLRRFDPDMYPVARRQEIRAALGLRPEHTVIGTVARFVREKGYMELLSAARTIKEKRSDVRFLFVGAAENYRGGGLDPQVIREMGLDDVVTFLGHRSDVADLYSVMNILALPSYREGFPRAPMEAAAMGVPAVVTNIRGCRQTVDHGVTGYLVAARDSAALANALLRLVEDPDARRRFGQAARRKAAMEFDEQIIFERIRDVYAQLLSRRRLLNCSAKFVYVAGDAAGQPNTPTAPSACK